MNNFNRIYARALTCIPTEWATYNKIRESEVDRSHGHVLFLRKRLPPIQLRRSCKVSRFVRVGRLSYGTSLDFLSHWRYTRFCTTSEFMTLPAGRVTAYLHRLDISTSELPIAPFSLLRIPSFLSIQNNPRFERTGPGTSSNCSQGPTSEMQVVTVGLTIRVWHPLKRPWIFVSTHWYNLSLSLKALMLKSGWVSCDDRTRAIFKVDFCKSSLKPPAYHSSPR